MAESFTIETACAAIQALLLRMKKELGPESMQRIGGLFQEVAGMEKPTIKDNNNPKDDDIVQLTGDEQTENESSTEDEASTKGKRQKKTPKKSCKKLKDNDISLPSISQQAANPVEVAHPQPPPTMGITAAPKKVVTISTATKKTTPLTTTTKATTPKTPGMPPIIVFSANIAEISRFAKGMMIGVTLKNLNTTKTVINATTKEGFLMLREYLKTRKIENHTYTIREERKILLLLKGIHHTYSAIEVKDELQTEGIPAVNVSVFKSRKAKKSFNSFVVEVSKSCNVAEIYSKNLILNQKVHWERLKNNDIVQCKNCQRFGHVATNCGMNYVCVKCNESHSPGECKRKEKDDRVYCANCKEFGHPANYLGCKVLLAKKEAKKKAEAEKKVHQEMKVKSVCTLTHPTLSFAAVTKMNSKPSTQNAIQPKQASRTQHPTGTCTKKNLAPREQIAPRKLNLDEEVKEHFGTDLETAIKKARSSIPGNYAALSKEKKSVALATFIFELCSA